MRAEGVSSSVVRRQKSRWRNSRRRRAITRWQQPQKWDSYFDQVLVSSSGSSSNSGDSSSGSSGSSSSSSNSAPEASDKDDCEDLSRRLYDIGDFSAGQPGPAGGEGSGSGADGTEEWPPPPLGPHRLTSLCHQLANGAVNLATCLLPTVAALVFLSYLHFYLFHPVFMAALPSHWATIGGFIGAGFKIFLCASLLIGLFASMALAIARQATIARALTEADLQSSVWQLCVQNLSAKQLSRTMMPRKIVHMIGCKWAHFCATAKRCGILLSIAALLFWHGCLFLSNHSFRASYVFDLLSAFLAPMFVCLLSADILAVQWDCIGAACLLNYLVLLTFSWLQNLSGTIRHNFLLTNFLAFKDALDHVPRLDLDRLGWLAGNTGSGPDLLSHLITVLIDGVIIGALHESNAVSATVRLLSVCGPGFLGLSGVEALAVLASQVFSVPCLVLLVFPYLRQMSESEAAFVFSLAVNCGTASMDRTFLYHGVNRDAFLLQAVFLKHMAVIGSIIVCKILYPDGTTKQINRAEQRHITTSSAGISLFQRVIAGALTGLKLAMLVCKVFLIARLSSVIACLLLDVCFQYLSCLTYSTVSVRMLIAFALMPMLFLMTDSQENLHWLCSQIADIVTFKDDVSRSLLIDLVRSQQVWLVYGNMTGNEFQQQADSTLLTAKYFYEPNLVRNHSIVGDLTPAFAAYMTDESQSLVEHAIFVLIFFFHCMADRRFTGAMASKVLVAVLLVSLLNIRLMTFVVIPHQVHEH